MAAIQDEKIKANLIYNYGIVLSELLANYRVLMKFYDDEMKIGKNKWYATKNGKTYLSSERLFYEKTMIDKRIIYGEKKIFIKKDSEFRNDQDELASITYIINLYEENPVVAEKLLKSDYDTDFRKLFKYVISLTGKVSNTIKDKLDKVIENLYTISGLDYMSLDMEKLKQINDLMTKHMELSAAVIKIKLYDK